MIQYEKTYTIKRLDLRVKAMSRFHRYKSVISHMFKSSRTPYNNLPFTKKKNLPSKEGAAGAYIRYLEQEGRRGDEVVNYTALRGTTCVRMYVQASQGATGRVGLS